MPKRLRFYMQDPTISNQTVDFALRNGSTDPDGLLVLMDHVDPRVRHEAVNFWGDVPKSVLIKGLSDPDKIVRINAEHRFKDLPYMEELRDHPHPFVKRVQHLAWIRGLTDPDKLRELAFGEAKKDDAVLICVLENENTPLDVLRTLCGNFFNPQTDRYYTVMSSHLPVGEQEAILKEEERLNRPRRSGETGMWGQGE